MSAQLHYGVQEVAHFDGSPPAIVRGTQFKAVAIFVRSKCRLAFHSHVFYNILITIQNVLRRIHVNLPGMH